MLPITRRIPHYYQYTSEESISDELKDELKDAIDDTVRAYRDYTFVMELWESPEMRQQFTAWLQNEGQLRYDVYRDASARFQEVVTEIESVYGFASTQFIRRARIRLNSRLRYRSVRERRC
ncbi:hypothetical protein D9758_009671 [Tetrapyrgos nigripes]|uniref:Uncharacterized protein n=1 Tax=Tetrapyrgos nigripes TaxID=182062 RepID=A0A8H5CNT0_9AGAR|nr:hypothetical protein D9758_009671 [Tetrapyrgos nigripes]